MQWVIGFWKLSSLSLRNHYHNTNSVSLFQVMLLANGSIVIPSDEDNLVSSHNDPFILQFVENPPDSATKETSKCAQTLIEKTTGDFHSCSWIFYFCVNSEYLRKIIFIQTSCLSVISTDRLALQSVQSVPQPPWEKTITMLTLMICWTIRRYKINRVNPNSLRSSRK
jgi:hypothetical protein